MVLVNFCPCSPYLQLLEIIQLIKVTVGILYSIYKKERPEAGTAGMKLREGFERKFWSSHGRENLAQRNKETWAFAKQLIKRPK